MSIQTFPSGTDTAGIGHELPLPAFAASGAGTGTVTSVGLSISAFFTISGSPVTTTGTLTATWANQSANAVLAGPISGGAAAPTFRSLVAADLPIFVASGASHAVGAVPDPGSVTGTTKFLREDATWAVPGGGTGTVTSVAMTVPVEFAIGGSPVTTAGTLAVTKATQIASTAWMGPTSGVAAQPTFRAIAASDLPIGPVGTTTTTPRAGAFIGDTTLYYFLGSTNGLQPTYFGCNWGQYGSNAGSSQATTLFQQMAGSYATNGGTPGNDNTCNGYCQTFNKAFWRGNGAGLGGFYCVWLFAIDRVNHAARRFAVGLFPSNAALSTADPSSYIDCVFVGADATETTLSIMHNDATGTCTKVALGGSFPCNNTSTDKYKLELWCAPNDSTIGYRMTHMISAATTSGSLSTNLPTSTVFLAAHFSCGTGASGGAGGHVDIYAIKFYGEVPY